MTPTCKRYLIALSLGVRFTLGVANGAAAPNPESEPSLAAPTAPAQSRPAPARAAGGDESARPGQVIDGPPLTLYHGEVQVLDLPEVTRVAVGSGDVLQAKVVASSQVVLIGQAAGNTSLRVWTRRGTQFSYQIAVRSFDVAQILRDVQDLLAGEPGIAVRQVDGHVLIEGDYNNSQAAGRLAALQKIYPQIISTVPVPQDRPPVQHVAKEKMVYMDVRVVEILKSTLRRLGVNWASQIAGPGLTANLAASKGIPHPPNGGLFGIATNLASALDLTEQAGESWTLAEPTVSCRSGGEAKFQVGGEIPIPVAGGLGTVNVVYHEYGIILEFKPVADEEGNVSSSIVAEVSEPDQSRSNVNNNGLFAFTKTRTQTEVALKVNQTLVISGLLSDVGSRSAVGIPGVKDVPVLGRLFKSNQYQNDRTELVVVVTPRTLDATGELNAATLQRAGEMEARVTPTVKWINGRKAE
jgi:pilus assembly protein CpaC